MPAATRYPVTQQEHTLADNAFSAEMDTRRKAIKKNWQYYQGEHHQHLKTDGTGTNDNLTINAIESIVDKAVAGLIGTDDAGNVIGIKFDIVDQPGEKGFMAQISQRLLGAIIPGQQPAPSKAQEYLDHTLRANKDNTLWLKVLLVASITGHVFVKQLPTGKVDSLTGKEVPRLINLNPANTGVFWQEDDMERVLWYRIEYNTTRQDIVMEVTEDGIDTGKWIIIDYKRQSSMGGRWDETGREVWSYNFSPVVDWQNLPMPNSYYGKDDIGKLGQLNDGLNFVASNTQRIIKHHAHPKTIGTGMQETDVKPSDVNSLWTVSNTDARIYNLEMQSDLGSSLVWINTLMRFIFDFARELSPGAVQDKLGAITNFGLRVLFRDTLAKSGVKRMLASDGMAMIARNILEFGGFDRRVAINIIWPDPLPNDPLEEARALEIDVAHGLSEETYLERRGHDPEQEAQRRQLTRAEKLEDETVGRQAALADTIIAREQGIESNAGQSANGEVPARPGRLPPVI